MTTQEVLEIINNEDLTPQQMAETLSQSQPSVQDLVTSMIPEITAAVAQTLNVPSVSQTHSNLMSSQLQSPLGDVTSDKEDEQTQVDRLVRRLRVMLKAKRELGGEIRMERMLDKWTDNMFDF